MKERHADEFLAMDPALDKSAPPSTAAERIGMSDFSKGGRGKAGYHYVAVAAPIKKIGAEITLGACTESMVPKAIENGSAAAINFMYFSGTGTKAWAQGLIVVEGKKLNPGTREPKIFDEYDEESRKRVYSYDRPSAHLSKISNYVGIRNEGGRLVPFIGRIEGADGKGDRIKMPDGKDITTIKHEDGSELPALDPDKDYSKWKLLVEGGRDLSWVEKLNDCPGCKHGEDLKGKDQKAERVAIGIRETKEGDEFVIFKSTTWYDDMRLSKIMHDDLGCKSAISGDAGMSADLRIGPGSGIPKAGEKSTKDSDPRPHPFAFTINEEGKVTVYGNRK